MEALVALSVGTEVAAGRYLYSGEILLAGEASQFLRVVLLRLQSLYLFEYWVASFEHEFIKPTIRI